jgi:hypothetical protein
MPALAPYEHLEVKAITTRAIEAKKGNVMSTTTVFGQVGTDQASTHNKRNAVIVFTVIALFALSFFVGRATATSHVSSTAQVATHAQLSPADRAIVTNEVAPLSNTVATELSPADRAIVADDAPVAPVTPLGQANTTSCIAGRPC